MRSHTANLRGTAAALLTLCVGVSALAGQRRPNLDPGDFGRKPPMTKPVWAVQSVTRLTDGRLEPTWADSGATYSAVNPLAMCTLPDGKLLVAGAGPGGATCVQRLLPDGNQDTTFGNQGRLFLRGDGQASAIDLQVDKLGRAVLLCSTLNPALGNYGLPRPLLARFAGNDLDPTFGTRGVAVVAPAPLQAPNCDHHVFTLDNDNHPVVGSASWAGQNQVALTRILDNGSRDPAFGNATYALGAHRNLQLTPSCLVCDGMNRLYLVSNHLTAPLAPAIELVPNADGCAIFRFDPSGAPDATWGTQGVVFVGPGNDVGVGVLAAAAAPAPRGGGMRLYGAGFCVGRVHSGCAWDMTATMFAFQENGNVDASVWPQGMLKLEPKFWPLRDNTRLARLHLDGERRLTVVGLTHERVSYDIHKPPASFPWGLFAMRCLPDGKVDTTFGKDAEFAFVNWPWIANAVCATAMDRTGHLFLRGRR